MDQEKTLIFDFDGTMADTFQSVVDILNRLASKFGHKPVDEADVARFKNDGTHRFFQSLGVTALLLPLIVREVQREQGHEIEEMKPVPGLTNVIRKLKRRGYRMGIVSSNSNDNVKRYLELHHLTTDFDFIQTGGLFGKDRVIEKIVKQRGIPVDQAIYIGDETRDVEAAHQAGVKVVAVSWGYQPHNSLAVAKPDWLIDQPEMLLKLFGSYPWWKTFWNVTRKVVTWPVTKFNGVRP